MATKGFTHDLVAKQKISLANTKDRTDLLLAIVDYIKGLKDDDFPSIVDCAISASISEKALLKYEATTAENSDIRVLLDMIRDRSKAKLYKNGLSKKYDSKLAVTLLKADHGLKEEPTNLTQNNTFNISPELLADALEISRSKK